LIEFLAVDRAGNAAATYFYPYAESGSAAGCSCDSSRRSGALCIAIVVLGLTRRRYET
jgi:hypothetical protein